MSGATRPTGPTGPAEQTQPAGPAGPIRFGAQLWSQAVDWPDFLDAAQAAEAGGWETVWTWDHLNAIFGPWQQGIHEGWLSMAAFAARTSRIGVGLLVGANTFRNPGLTAKLAATLDQISGGRATLGIGAAWFEREHEAFGIPFGTSPGWRLDMLAEAVPLMRRLLDGEQVTHAGRFYTFTDALIAPRPVQAHLPFMIGGSGLKKTLRIVAEHADAWNTSGLFEPVKARMEALLAHCEAVGRDPATLEKSVSFPVIIRDDPAEARRAYQERIEHNGTPDMGPVPNLLGTPEQVADGMRPFVELGFGTIIVRLAAPHDRETLARIGEVRALLSGGAAGGGAA